MTYTAMSRKRFPGQQYQSPLMMQPPSPTPSGGGLGFGINGSQGPGGLSDLLTSLGIGLLTGRNPSEGLGLGLQQANVMAGDRRQDRRFAQRDAQDAERFGFEKQKYQTELDQNAASQADTAQRTEAFGQYVQQMPVDAQTKQFILSQGPDSPAGQQIMKSLFPEAQGASSSLGKLAEDMKAGRISPEEYQAAVRKENYIAPAAGQGPTERERNALSAGLQKGTPEYQQYLLGKDDTAPGPFQGTGLDAQSYNMVLMGDPTKPEYAAAYAQLAMPKVNFDAVTGKFVIVQPDMTWARKPDGQTQVTALAQGNTTQVPGATITSNQGAPIYNEGQGKAATFSDRMIQSEDSFSTFQGAGMDRMEGWKSQVPIIGNSLVSSDRQQFDQAERNFINAQLRRESGAVISPEEFVEARKQYIPQPGDDAKTLAQKKESRRIAREGMARESGPFYNKGGAENYESMYGLTPTN